MDATLDFAVNLYFSKLNASNIKKTNRNPKRMKQKKHQLTRSILNSNFFISKIQTSSNFVSKKPSTYPRTHCKTWSKLVLPTMDNSKSTQTYQCNHSQLVP